MFIDSSFIIFISMYGNKGFMLNSFFLFISLISTITCIVRWFAYSLCWNSSLVFKNEKSNYFSFIFVMPRVKVFIISGMIVKLLIIIDIKDTKINRIIGNAKIMHILLNLILYLIGLNIYFFQFIKWYNLNKSENIYFN